MGFWETFGPPFPWLVLVALAVSAVGFYKYVYFISLGYGFSVAALGVVMAALFAGELTAGTALLCLLLAVYGCRLGGYLLLREVKSASYRTVMKREIKGGKGMGLARKGAIWLSCALLYALQVSPVYFRLRLGAGTDGFCLAGAAVMLCGLTMEAAADAQKSKAKKKDPARFCDSGLYRLVRCPNYLGEVLFWTGVLLSGAGALRGVWAWTAAAVGWVCIVYIMFGGARRLELRQERNYGSDPAYRAYVRSTPILLPFVPLYSVAGCRWLLG